MEKEVRGSSGVRRIHFCKQELILPLEDRNPVCVDKGMYKPEGLWYGVGWAWRKWCESNVPEWTQDRLVYEVDVAKANMLFISTPDQLMRFHNEYVTLEMGRSVRIVLPDWERVSQKYDGIEISPYQWEFRLHAETFWYYGWDCASGVVWNASKVGIRGPLVGSELLATILEEEEDE